MPAILTDDINKLGYALGPGGAAAAARLVPFQAATEDTYSARGSSALSTDYAAVTESGFGRFQSTTITLDALPVSMTDVASTVAYGAAKVYDFPAGNILILGCTVNLTSLVSGAGINDDYDGDFGVGTVTASNNSTLSSTEQNIVPSTPTTQAVAGATTAVGINIAAIAPLDGTATAVDMYLNVLVDDADQDITGGGATSILYSGTITFSWVNLGDK